MSLEIKGFDEFDRTLELLGTVGNRVGAKAVRAGMKVVVNQMKEDAPNNPSGVSPIGIPYKKTKGAKALKITKVKTYSKTGTAIARAGIDKSNWDKTKHLYYHHYGYENKGLKNKFRGRRVKRHIGWMNVSFEKSKSKGEKEVKAVVQSELNKIFKR